MNDDIVVGNNARRMSDTPFADVLLSDLTDEARRLLEAALKEDKWGDYDFDNLEEAALAFAMSVVKEKP